MYTVKFIDLTSGSDEIHCRHSEFLKDAQQIWDIFNGSPSKYRVVSPRPE